MIGWEIKACRYVLVPSIANAQTGLYHLLNIVGDLKFLLKAIKSLSKQRKVKIV